MAEKILIIDDDKTLTQMVKIILSTQKYETVAVHDVESALDLLLDWRPDLILLDIMMPKRDGFEALGFIRQNENTSTTPIIMLTAKPDIEAKTIAFQTGADDYIVKPFNKEELLLRVGAHLRRYRISSEQDRFVPVQAIRVPIVLNQSRSGMFLKGYRISKRLFDIFVALFALPFAIPMMILIAILIRIESPGPIVFPQDRTGMNGKRFKMYKFRTMVQNAEELKQKYMHLNELTWPDFKITDDPRVTRIGRFLRKSSLDELPQLINILRGDMSFVGPRPTSFSADTYDLWHTERLEVRPGLTGLWQIKGRADIDFDDRVELDIEYIERQSWTLDLTILLQTFSAVLSRRGAS
jgi:lipopolysaccharide/colanic/teichoic acid biosynthesis glycosyltransferase/ActR/RegA family two-component response regulator